MGRRSSGKNRKAVPFDRERVPPKQNLFFLPLIWLISFLGTRSGRLKIKKVAMAGLKPPFLVLSNHQSFLDFYIAALALFPHRANYVSEIEGFQRYGEWLVRQGGCLGTRKYTLDLALIKNIKRVMARQGILVLYPEARFSNDGTPSVMPDSLGKLVKHLGVPVVTINIQGDYLTSPIWNMRKRKGVPLTATVTQLLPVAEIKDSSAVQINTKIRQALAYDEYAYQRDDQIKITESWRAEGLEELLYRCRKCHQEFQMKTAGSHLWCEACGEEWELTVSGDLLATSDGETFTIPQWYEWERCAVATEIDQGRYYLDALVEIEALPNARGFVKMGRGRLVQDNDGFQLHFDDGQPTLLFPPADKLSVHIDYDFRKRGKCITLSEPDNTYFIYPLAAADFNVTKIQLAAEYMHLLFLKK